MKAEYAEVVCEKHGRFICDDDAKKGIKRVKVSVPQNKRERFLTGCPKCHMEKNQA